MARYTVTRASDSFGHRYSSGPLTFYRGDDLGKAMREVHARGGEVVDHETRRAWAPGLGWYDVSEAIDTIPEAMGCE